MNFNNYKFRCSSLGMLMTKPRSKSEVLSETAKNMLLDIYVEEVYGRKKDISNKYLEKGNFAEEVSLTLATDYLDELLIKNKETLENDWIKGTPDIINPYLIDIKTCWDIHTFIRKNEKVAKADYYWQLWGYMFLTDLQDSFLIYTLVNAPEHLIVDEKTRQMYKRGLIGMEGTKEFDEMESEIEKEMMFDDIEPSKRLKMIRFEFNSELEVPLFEKIEHAREYLNNLSL